MNIHEHQAKKILMEFGAPVSKGIVILSVEDIKKEIIKLKSNEYVLKAQIHAGGRGKAGHQGGVPSIYTRPDGLHSRGWPRRRTLGADRRVHAAIDRHSQRLFVSPKVPECG